MKYEFKVFTWFPSQTKSLDELLTDMSEAGYLIVHVHDRVDGGVELWMQREVVEQCGVENC